MPLFVKTISLDSALPPGALLDRIRGFASGKAPLPRQSRWRSPMMWSLREQGDTIRLMPLSPPDYLARQPSLVGTIEPEGSGSRVTGRVAPYSLSVWMIAFVVLMDAVMSAAGVAQQFARHDLSQALLMALFGIAFAAAALSLLLVSVSWAAADIRWLLEHAASGATDRAIDASASQPTDAIVPGMNPRSPRASLVLRAAAAVDLLIALFLITSTSVSARVGRPVTVLIAAILASGAAVLLVIARRFRGAS